MKRSGNADCRTAPALDTVSARVAPACGPRRGSILPASCSLRGHTSMKRFLPVLLLAVSLGAMAQNKKPPTDLRGVLLEQLRTTHNDEDWFVPAKIAVDGLTAE